MDEWSGRERRQQQTVDSPPGTLILCAQPGVGAERERVDVFARGACNFRHYRVRREGIDTRPMGGTRLLLREFDHSITTIILPTATGGALCLSLMLGGLGLSRRLWSRRMKTKEEEWRKTISGLQIQLAASRSSEDMLKLRQVEGSEKEHEEHVKQQELKIAQLQTELDHLKRAEKSLSQRRQELESSKTVLELHVQERTGELQKLQRRYELILIRLVKGSVVWTWRAERLSLIPRFRGLPGLRSRI